MGGAACGEGGPDREAVLLPPARVFPEDERGCLKTWTRLLNVHEYQGAKHMAGFGVNVPPGIVAFSVPEAVEAAKEMDGGSGEVSRRARAKNGRGSAQRGPRSLDPRVKGEEEEEEELRELTPFSRSLARALRSAGRREEPDSRGRSRLGHLQERPPGRRPHLQNGGGRGPR